MQGCGSVGLWFGWLWGGGSLETIIIMFKSPRIGQIQLFLFLKCDQKIQKSSFRICVARPRGLAGVATGKAVVADEAEAEAVAVLWLWLWGGGGLLAT